MIGKSNWWLPGWLDRILPKVQIEPGEEEIQVVDDRGQDASPQPVG
jgi:RND superfamily putative drug exporter